MRPTRTVQVFLLLMVFIATSGQRSCVTTSQGQNLQTEMDVLRARMDDLEARHKAFADGITTSNSAAANLVADFDEVRAEVQDIRGKYEDLGYTLENLGKKEGDLKEYLDGNLRELDARIQRIEKKLGIESPAVPLAPSGPAATDRDLYEEAYSVYKAGRYEEAKSKFRAFLKKHPDSRYASNAQFWLGECFYAQGDYENAVLEFDKIITNHPSSQKVASAYLKIGYSFLKMGENADAKLFFKKVISDFPDTEQAEIARRKLKQLP